MDCEVVDQQKRQYCKIETRLTKDNQEKDYIYMLEAHTLVRREEIEALG